MSSLDRFIKSAFDRIVAFVGILVLWPVILIIALLVHFRMGDGPVFFTQKRVGQYGKLFTIIKFRTMTAGNTGSSVTVAGEERIHPFGAGLRRYHLDELPELWNVLKGDMSFVGPRPDVPGYADMLQGEDKVILSLKPGITGPATLKYRNEEYILAKQPDPARYNDEVIFPDKVRINRYYLEHYSFLQDIRIIIATVTGRHFEYGGETI